MIIRIKNGYLARKEVVVLPHSKFREAVLKKLVEIGFVKGYKTKDKPFKSIEAQLLYKNGNPAMTDVKIFSKPGVRYYVSYKDLKIVRGGLGFSILSTPKGILTNVEAKREKVGGELLFSIW